MGRNRRDRRNDRLYRTPGNVDVGRLRRVNTGGYWQLALECTRGNTFPTDRKSAITAVMDIMDVAISNSLGPAEAGARRASGAPASSQRPTLDSYWRCHGRGDVLSTRLPAGAPQPRWRR